VSSFALTEKERNALMEQVYGGFQKNPTYTEAAGVDGSDSEYSHGRAGEVDFYAYGGDARDIGDSEDFYMAKHHDQWKNYGTDHPIEGYTYGDRWRNRDTWKKVKDHLGIDRLDSKDELRQMYDFVSGYSKEKPKEDTVQEPSEPPTFTPSEGLQNLRDEYESTPDNPTPRMSDQEGVKGPSNTSNPYLDAITHGDDLNDWYTRDTKRRELEAQLAGMEIGERTRFHANRFVGKLPEIGDAGKLYQNYADKLKDMD
tara:strand:+ start:313 stop:1080 length:768 start_codon:yes stop_codon:yes gene_type:complete